MLNPLPPPKKKQLKHIIVIFFSAKMCDIDIDKTFCTFPLLKSPLIYDQIVMNIIVFQQWFSFILFFVKTALE